MTKNRDRGWALLPNSRKAHYFVEGRSLCNRWMFFGEVDDTDFESPDDCKACRKKLGPAPQEATNV